MWFNNWSFPFLLGWINHIQDLPLRCCRWAGYCHKSWKIYLTTQQRQLRSSRIICVSAILIAFQQNYLQQPQGFFSFGELTESVSPKNELFHQNEKTLCACLEWKMIFIQTNIFVIDVRFVTFLWQVQQNLEFSLAKWLLKHANTTLKNDDQFTSSCCEVGIKLQLWDAL